MSAAFWTAWVENTINALSFSVFCLALFAALWWIVKWGARD